METATLVGHAKRTLAVATVVLVAVLVVGFVVVNATRTSPGKTGSVVTLVTTQGSTTGVEPWSYSILGQTPYLIVGPGNHTFTVPFEVTTRNYSISLTYSQADSYAWLFSNGTQWASSARACEPVTTVTLTRTGTYTVTAKEVSSTSGYPPILTHTSQVPCGEYPGEWWALNGTLISQHVAITSNDIQFALQPSNIPAHYSGKMNATFSVQMPPGNYALFLAVHVQEPNNPNISNLLYILYYMPVVVEGT
jgi:hypothetical protein